MSATLRMWKNRIQRMRDAWREPGDNSQFSIDGDYSWKIAIGLSIFVTCFSMYLIWKAEVLYNVGDFLTIAAVNMGIHFGLYKLSDCDSDDAGNSFIAALVMTLLSLAATSMYYNKVFWKDPVNQTLFDWVKKNDPTCGRYEDYRRWAVEKKEIFTIRDLDRARDECSVSREKNAALEAQKKLK